MLRLTAGLRDGRSALPAGLPNSAPPAARSPRRASAPGIVLGRVSLRTEPSAGSSWESPFPNDPLPDDPRSAGLSADLPRALARQSPAIWLASALPSVRAGKPLLELRFRKALASAWWQYGRVQDVLARACGHLGTSTEMTKLPGTKSGGRGQSRISVTAGTLLSMKLTCVRYNSLAYRRAVLVHMVRRFPVLSQATLRNIVSLSN